MGKILPNGAGADTIGAVLATCPSGALHPRRLGRRTKEATMTTKLVALVLLCLMTGTAMAQQAQVTELMSKDLPENPGKEMLMIIHSFPTRRSSVIGRASCRERVYAWASRHSGRL